ACRTAQRARAVASRMPPGSEEPLEVLAVAPESVWSFDLRPLLHEEIGRLPEKYRSPIVLCHLEGRTHEEAARLLRWPVGSVSGRLSRGRRLLRSRLERRGVTVSAALLAAAWFGNTASAVTPTLVEQTLKAAAWAAGAETVSASVLSLAQGVLKTMFV